MLLLPACPRSHRQTQNSAKQGLEAPGGETRGKRGQLRLSEGTSSGLRALGEGSAALSFLDISDRKEKPVFAGSQLRYVVSLLLFSLFGLHGIPNMCQTLGWRGGGTAENTRL